MKSINQALLTILVTTTAMTTATKSVFAQNIYDPWSNQNYDVSECVNQGYNSCWVDSHGDVYGSDSYDTSTYVTGDTGYYTPLNESNNYYDPYGSHNAPASSPTYVPYPSPSGDDAAHQKFINSIYE